MKGENILNNGYMGKILIIDLSTKHYYEEELNDEIYRTHLTGVGLGVYYLYNNMKPKVDALGPDNIIGFMSGILTGTGAVMTGRWAVVTKSPLTGGWGDSNCGGNLSPQIKKCGYDGIFIKGKSEKPIYLLIKDNQVEFKDAVHIWGQDTMISEEILIKENLTSKKPSVAVIGVAGEKLSLIAGISNDKGRYAGRSGVGAVMGSKMLKGIVLMGTHVIDAYDKDRIKELTKQYTEKVKNTKLPAVVKGSMLPIMGYLTSKQKKFGPMDGMITVAGMKKWGTIANNTLGITNGDNPIKNWAGTVVDYPLKLYKNINPDKIIKREVKKYFCYSCVIGCGSICNVSDIKEIASNETHKPEYETCNAFGALILNDNLNKIFEINDILNRGGMDSISAGNTVSFAIECYENNIINKKDTNGLVLKWSNIDDIIKLLKLMIFKEGIGEIFADGVKKASERLGKESVQFAMHVGGQEPGMHDGRMDPILGVHYSIDPTPGRHTIGAGTYYNVMHLWEYVSWAPKILKNSAKKDEFLPSDTIGLKTAANACIKQVLDGSGGCLFALTSGLNHWKLFDYINAATGWEMKPDEYMETGRRIQSLRQAFNIREGINPIDFKLNDRMSGIQPLTEGPLKNNMIPIIDMMKIHWKHMGWDENGKPNISM